MANISDWSKNLPSGDSSIRQGDDLLRSHWSILQATLDEEHYFDPDTSASSASAGIHRQGSARAFVVGSSDLSSDGNAGKLSYRTDTQSLHIDVDGSSLVTLHAGTMPFGVKSFLSTTASIESFVDTELSFDSVAFDDGGFFTVGQSVFTIPVDGRYSVTGAVLWQTMVGKHGIKILHNTVEVANSFESTQVGQGSAQNAHTVIQASSGDTLSFVVRQESGGLRNADNGVGSTYGIIQKL